MPRVLRLFACLLATLVIALPVCGQEPDLQALMSIANATDVETAARYFPPDIQEAIAKLPKEMREELNRVLPIPDKARERNITLQISTDSGPFLLYDDPKGGFISHLEFYLHSRKYGNDLSELTFHIQDRPDSTDPETTILRLKFIYPDWRVYEAESLRQHETYRLDDEKLVGKMIDSMLDGNESSARGQLLNYANELYYYATLFPNSGIPESLTQLGPPDEFSEPNENRAGLMNDELTTPPFEHERYRFTYKRIDSEHFTVVARAVKFGVTGRRSFYIDESRKIRYTDGDQAPDRLSKLWE